MMRCVEDKRSEENIRLTEGRMRKTPNAHQKSIERPGELIEDFRAPMLTTMDEAGEPHGLPCLSAVEELTGIYPR